MLVEPTAQTSVAAEADTAFSFSLNRNTLGVGSAVHAVPFQCSARMAEPSSSFARSKVPTAHASVLVRAVTALNTLVNGTPSGTWSGVGVETQVDAARALPAVRTRAAPTAGSTTPRRRLMDDFMVLFPLMAQPTTRKAIEDDCPVVPSHWLPTAHSVVASAVVIAPSVGMPTPPVTVTGVTVHVVPFQWASAGLLGSSAAAPVTQTSVADRAVTPPRFTSGGAATVCHEVPFHRTTRAAPLVPTPTAHASVAESAATSYRNVLPLLGLAIWVHAVPSQCRICDCRIRLPYGRFSEYPTAQTSRGETPSTAVRKLVRVPALGVGTAFHE